MVSLTESIGRPPVHFADTAFFFLIKESEAHGKSVRATFKTAHAHFLSLFYILLTVPIFQVGSLLHL